MLNILNFFAEQYDLPILDWIQANLRSDLLDAVMPIITYFGEGGIFWIACAVILMFLPRQRKAGISMGLALLMGLILCNLTLKPMVMRMRPYDYQLEHFGVEIALLIEAQHDYSFPSGHTIASFEACAALMYYNKKLGIPATILACLIAFSRLYLYVHYPTDVLTSIVLGVFLGLLATWIVENGAKLLPAGKGRFQKS